MKKLSLLVLILAQLACSTLAPTPTETPIPTPTATSTPLPTPTPVPTSTAVPEPEAPRVFIDDGAYSMVISPDLDFDINGEIIGIFDRDGLLIISFARAPYDASGTSLQDVIDDYIQEISSDDSQFVQEEAVPVTIGGAEGISVDLSGTLFDAPIGGRAVAVSPDGVTVFFGLGVSNQSNDDDLWETGGSVIFQALIDSVIFDDLQTGATGGDCPVSTDATYGYTEANPIRVGGDFLDGPARERAYLDNLRGPNGETITYERLGSFPSGDTILDEYRVTGGGLDVTLYLDEYLYEPLQAPQGFTCAGEFIPAP
jgi:hypothetical protein